MLRQTLGFSAALAVLLMVGCANFQKGETVVKWSANDPARMAEAPTDGRYALYSGTDLRNPQVQYNLKKGDRLGFVTRDGKTYAVAGDNEQPVEVGTITKSYFWRKVS
jgi:hypothetical protein